MSEIQLSGGKHKDVKRAKIHSTKVDLTPMVDLGFLLITFFIFTSALARPLTMKITLPDESETHDLMLASEDKTITILLGRQDTVFYYFGRYKNVMSTTDLRDLRSIISAKKEETYKKFKTRALVVLIKPTVESSYKNTVDCLDEMVINDVSTYMLLEPTQQELKGISYK